jgi:8-oxo-dGTP pyrophosphatase MutT (NUDIX family)
MNDTIRRYSSGGVVYDNGKVLVIKWVSRRNSIEFPKGTIESNETKEETCIREVFEETGYKTAIVQSLGDTTYEFDWDDGRHYKKTVYNYLLKLVDDSEPTPNREYGEDFENMWLTPNEAAAQLTFDDSRETLQKALDTIKQLGIN